MATSGSKSVTVTSYDTLKFSWEQKSQSIANNTTTISWKMELIATSAGKISSTASKNWSVTVNGTKYSGTNTVGISNNTTKTLASGTTTISHNSDGTKSFNYSFSQEFAITFAGSSVGTKSGSGSGTLDTIPRASSMTWSGSTMGSVINFSITSASSSFTHSITWAFGNQSGTLASYVGTSASWTPSLDLARQIPNATSGIGTYTLHTFANGITVGTKSYSFTLNVPSGVVPSINSISISEGTAGINVGVGNYIQGKSRLKVITNASGSYGSSITSYKIIGIDNGIYNSSNFTSNVLTITGTRTITITVTDSRGRTTITTREYTCNGYNAPLISQVSAVRCNDDGTDNEEGNRIKYTFKANVTWFDNNACSYKIGYKTRSSSTYTYISLGNNFYTLDKSNVVIEGVTFDVNTSYDFEFVVEDYFNKVVRTVQIGTAYALLNFNASGKGLGIGKVSEKNALEIGMTSFDKYGKEIFSPLLGGIGGQCKTVEGDWNTACGNMTGFYMGRNLTNRPTDMSTVDSWFYVIHLVHNETFQTQIFLSFGANEISIRSMNGGNWSGFKRII